MVFDLYCLDNAGLEFLIQNGQPFICSIKAYRFKAHTDRMKKKVDEIGKWSGIYNAGKKLVFIHHWSKDVGKKFVISNAFRCYGNRQQPANRPPVWCKYKETFSICNHFNHMLNKCTYPFKRRGWQQSFDIFYDFDCHNCGKHMERTEV